MKKILSTRYLFVLLLILSPFISKANHAAGGEIIYEHIGDSTYRVFFKFYRDCSGPAAPAALNLCMYESCTNTTATVPFSIWPNTGAQISPGCSQYKTRCELASSPLPGYEEHWYHVVVTLPFQCNSWKFYTFIGNRNTSLNILNSNTLFFYVETTFNNTGSFRDNTSPSFSIKPIPYVCVNQPYSYNNGAVDVDRDSLVTEIIQPLTGVTACGGTPVATTFATATPAYNLINNPLQTNNSFTLNGATGQMNFTPTVAGAYIITVRTKEYRNGQLIGYIMRDVQVQVLSCNTPPPTFTIETAGITGGAWLANRINACINQQLNFCFNVKASDTDIIYVVEDNHSAVIPSAIVTYSNQLNDSVRGCVTWTPTASDVGLRNLIVTVKDSTCKPPGIMIYNSYTIPIYVWPPVKAVPDTSICPGETAYLNATGGGNYQWSVLPGGAPITSLNNPNIASPVATPTVKTTYVVTSTINTFCNNNKDTVVVDVLQGLEFTPIKDTITCPGNPISLDLKIVPVPGSVYKTKWTPSTYLDKDSISNPISTPKTTITYTVTISSNANQCKGYDTILVDVLKGFTLNNIDTAICDGQSIKVNINGDSRYSYSWTTDGNTGVFSNPNIIDPTITPSPVGKYKYKITASYPNCVNDSTAEFDIDLQPNPTVTLGEDDERCFGDTMKLNAKVFPANYSFTLNWTPGASLNNTTILDPIFKATETTTLTLTASTSAGCKSSDDIKIIVFPSKFIFATGDTAICPGTKTQLHLTGNGIKSFRWYPDIAISDKESFNPIVSPKTTQVYTIYGIDTNLCKDTQYVKVVVHPKATLELPDSVIQYPGQTIKINTEGNCMYFSWFPVLGLNYPNVSNPIVKADVNTKYIVQATTETGCTVTDSVNVLVAPESIIDVPNAFRPGIGQNSTFKVLHLGDATLKQFIIYNRWGTKVFETNNIDEGWDGNYKGQPQGMGVYVYTIEAISPTGSVYRKQGNVTLIR